MTLNPTHEAILAALDGEQAMLAINLPVAWRSPSRALHIVRLGMVVVGMAFALYLISAELLIIGATGHSALYERLIGSRADRIVQLAHCPVLVVK